MKTINDTQIKALLDAFYQANAPVQMYHTVQKLLNELPEVKEVKKELTK